MRLARAALLVSPFAAALLLFQEMVASWSKTGFGDYQYFHHAWELGRVAWSRYGELPLFNPYQCGGIPEWGDAQTQTFHPLFFLSFLIGTTLALKLFVLLHATAGIAGTYLYSRRALGFVPVASGVSALVWAGSGFFAWHCGTGHGGFVAFWLLPWLLLAWRATTRDLRFAVAVAGVLFLALLAGGAYVFPFFLIVLGFDAVVLWWRERRHRETLLAILSSGLLTALLGAWRVLPVLDELRLYPRSGLATDRLSLAELFHVLTAAKSGSDLGANLAGHPYGWAEYGSYVGVPVLAFAALGLVIALRSRRELVVGALVFGALVVGDVGRFAPWTLLTRLPVYSSLRVPSRFGFAFLFFVALLAGLALSTSIERARAGKLGFVSRRFPGWSSRRERIASLVLAAVLVVPVVMRHRQVLRGRWNEPAIQMAPVAERFHLTNVSPKPWERGIYPPPASFPQLNVGTGYCYTGMGYLPATGLWAGDVPQARASGSGTVLASGRTTRELWADVDLKRTGRLVFNQTWTPGFRASEGRIVRSEGRLALLLEPGKRKVSVRYVPASLYWAAAMTGLGLLVALLFTFRAFARELIPVFRASVFGLGLALFVAALGYRRALAEIVPKPPNRPRATASGWVEQKLNDLYRPDRAVDGNPKTEWLPPDGQPGWVELELSPPRHVDGIALLDARNRPYRNRQSQRFLIEAIRGDQVVQTVRVELDDGDLAQWTDVALDADDVARIRITIESWTRQGGGIAEVEVF